MTQPKTWEQATQDVAAGLPAFEDGENLTLEVVLESIEAELDVLRGNPSEMLGYSPETGFRLLAWYGAVGYVLEKFGPATKGSTQINFVQRCNDVVKSTLVLLPKKQHDYGPDNILWGGVQGVVVRAHDKLARIKNLKKRGTLPSNESLADSYFDLIGYGIVGAMLVKGTFQLPLEADLPDVAEREAGWTRAAHVPETDMLTEKRVREIVAVEVAKLAAVLQPPDYDWNDDEAIEARDEIRPLIRDELARREQRKLHRG